MSRRRPKSPKQRRKAPQAATGAGVSALVAAQVRAQCEANSNSVGHALAFTSHRENTTRLLLAAARPGARLCLLGAGNAYDVDLPALLQAYREVHLVDLDAQALGRAVATLGAEEAARVTVHAPVDLSGMVGRLDAWRRLKATAEELAELPAAVARGLVARLEGPFDVVVSLCLLTQLQLTLLNVLTDKHPLFLALRLTLNVVHLRSLAALTAPAGQALLVTDLTSNEIATLPDDAPQGWLALMADLLDHNQVIDVVRPEALASLTQEDPVLCRWSLSAPLAAWLWRAGPERRFLVYAAALKRV